MRFAIAERLHPFSHEAGISCLIPKSSCQLQVFPTLFHLRREQELLTWHLDLQGPIKEFTVEVDLEKAAVSVFGQLPQGYFRYIIERREEGIVFFLDRLPVDVLQIKGMDSLKKGEAVLLLPLEDSAHPLSSERLSLGAHKAQDWELICRRQDLREIFPHWLRLAATLPPLSTSERGGTLLLIDKCRALIEHQKKPAIASAFLNLFNAGFFGLLTPQLKDSRYLGLTPDTDLPEDVSPLVVLTESAALIRSLFLQEGEEEIALLPCLPPEFESGRFLHLQCENGDRIDLEWSKKLLRRVVLKSGSDHTLSLKLQSDIRSFRVRRKLSQKGLRHAEGEALILKEGETLYLDRFQK